MKLTYSILWFDDDEDYIDSVDLEPIKDAIESWGFTPNIVMVSNPADFMEHEPFKEFDLIAVGRALIANPDWANKVRDGKMDELVTFNKEMLGELV